MLLLALGGCAVLLQGSVGATGSPVPPGDANVSLQADLGGSPYTEDSDSTTAYGFGLSARSRVDDEGQMNDVGVHAFVVLGTDAPVRPFARSTLFALAAYDPKLELEGPGLGMRVEGGALFCPGDEGFYCLAAQVNTEYDGWFGADRSPFWIGGSLGIAINWKFED